MHRFIVEDLVLTASRQTVRGALAHQIARVLRLRQGERVVLFDGLGSELLCSLTLVTEQQVTATVEERRISADVGPLVHVYVGLLRGPRFELVLQKATELGVASITPVLSQRCVARPSGEGVPQRWRQIVNEAAEQCGRSRVPTLRAPVRYGVACADAGRSDVSLVCSEHGGSNVRSLLPSSAESVGLLFGPEGGLDPQEVQQAIESGLQPVSLGPLILRAETAVLAACAVTQCLIGGWDQPRARWLNETAVAS